eukprot:IDg9752t1
MSASTTPRRRCSCLSSHGTFKPDDCRMFLNLQLYLAIGTQHLAL